MKEEYLDLEQEFVQVMQERNNRILEAFLEDKYNPVIRVDKLAKAIGQGCTQEQLTNAAWENHLPFGFGYRSKNANKRGTVVMKDVFWRWWTAGGCFNEKIY